MEQESEARVLKVDKKADWGNIYGQSSPVAYFETMTPFDYGHYHDRFLEIIQNTLKANDYVSESKCIQVFEFGASYGNTTLGYRAGLNWEETGQVWHDDLKPIVPIHNMHVTACDLSLQALEYGLGRGIYDRIVQQDFNTILKPEIIAALDSSDMLFCIMISSYIKTHSLQRIVFNFLGDRSVKKIFAYNDTCAFDSRNLSPECLFAGVKNWTTATYFTKHRNFTDEESLRQHGCRESWSYTYVVTFEPIIVDNANVH